MKPYTADIPIINCPLCKKPLLKTVDSVVKCDKGHSYDIPKEGYLYLIPPNKKNSKSPGDNQEMIKARRAFLEAGYYQFLVRKTQEILSDLPFEKDTTALDLGCGEGYYTSEVLEHSITISHTLGTDISKAAIKLAAKKYKDSMFFVSSAFDIPIESASLDLVLSIFAPFKVEEIVRILRADGYMLVITAGSQHMRQIAEMVYAEFRPHKDSTTAKLETDFDIHKSEEIKFDLELDNSFDILNMLQMTPYFWHFSEDQLKEVSNLTNIKVSCDFKIELWKKK